MLNNLTKEPMLYKAIERAYEHGEIDILDIQEVNARQYEIQLSNNSNKPEWFYVNLDENSICTIDVKSRERGPEVAIVLD